MAAIDQNVPTRLRTAEKASTNLCMALAAAFNVMSFALTAPPLLIHPFRRANEKAKGREPWAAVRCLSWIHLGRLCPRD